MFPLYKSEYFSNQYIFTQVCWILISDTECAHLKHQGRCWNIGHQSEIHVKFNFREISFIHHISFSRLVMDKRDFSKLYIATNHMVPFYQHWLTSTSAWISSYIHYTVWDEITYPFPNFNGWAVGVWEWISNFITLNWACDWLLIHAGIILNHVSKRDPRLFPSG